MTTAPELSIKVVRKPVLLLLLLEEEEGPSLWTRVGGGPAIVLALGLGLGVFVVLLGGDGGVVAESFFFAALRVITVMSGSVQSKVRGRVYEFVGVCSPRLRLYLSPEPLWRVASGYYGDNQYLCHNR